MQTFTFYYRIFSSSSVAPLSSTPRLLCCIIYYKTSTHYQASKGSLIRVGERRGREQCFYTSTTTVCEGFVLITDSTPPSHRKKWRIFILTGGSRYLGTLSEWRMSTETTWPYTRTVAALLSSSTSPALNRQLRADQWFLCKAMF